MVRWMLIPVGYEPIFELGPFEIVGYAKVWRCIPRTGCGPLLVPIWMRRPKLVGFRPIFVLVRVPVAEFTLGAFDAFLSVARLIACERFGGKLDAKTAVKSLS